MQFYDQNNNLIDHLQIERPEQLLVEKYIRADDVVLELGARYGTVSCTINQKLTNKKNQVSVEPDQRVWQALEANRDRNGCQFHIIQGFVSQKKLGLAGLNVFLGGYGATFVDSKESQIPSYTLEEIEEKTGLHFNVLVADCEGFLERFFDENPRLYQELDLVIFEADYVEKCNYPKIRDHLRQCGFSELVSGHQNVWKKNKAKATVAETVRDSDQKVLESGAWNGNYVTQYHKHDAHLCAKLVEFFQSEGGSVVDLGCGLGKYVNGLRESGISCDGFDGNPETADLTGFTCGMLDLSQEINIPTFDWVLSLEVGEKIPRKYEETFIRNLDASNTRGIIISWGVEGQGGYGHVNERNNDYIKGIFTGMGYLNDLRWERMLRESASLWWLKNSLMVFRRISNKSDPSKIKDKSRHLVMYQSRIILLDRDPKRVKNVNQNIIPYLNDDSDSGNGTFKIQKAIDGKTGQIEEFINRLKEGNPQVNIVKNYVVDNTFFHLLRGQLGCTFSHMSIWKEVMDNGGPVTVILEDDCILNENFRVDVENVIGELPDDFDICYLYVFDKHYRNDADVVLDGKQYINKGYFTWTTLSYIISYQGALNLWGYFQNIDYPIDNKFCKLIQDGKLNAYSSKKQFIVNNGIATSIDRSSNKLQSNIWNSGRY